MGQEENMEDKKDENGVKSRDIRKTCTLCVNLSAPAPRVAMTDLHVVLYSKYAFIVIVLTSKSSRVYVVFADSKSFGFHSHLANRQPSFDTMICKCVVLAKAN